MSRHPMPSADAAWLRMDRAENLMVITSVLWFEEPIPVTPLRALLRARLVDRFPRYTQRVVDDGGMLGGPRWEDADDFDLDLHVHHVALPAPGGRAELQELVGDLMARPLDRTKPLWHVWVVDGYGHGGALVTRMHHCIADGIALARVMLSLTDPAPGAAHALSIEERAHERAHGPLQRVAAPLAPALGVAGALAHEGIETLLHPARVGRLPGEAAGVLRALAKEVGTPADPRGPLRGELHPAERVAWCRSIALADVQRIARAHDATVNDVLVAAVTGGLRRWMLARRPSPVNGHRPERLEHEIHAMVPFNLRPLDRPLPRELGNRFGLVLLALPLLEEDPVARLHEVHRRMRAIKDSPEGAVSYGVLGAMGLSPPAVEAQLIDLFSSKATLVLTNVPGPRAPVYLCGTRLRGVLVWAPCAGSVSTSVSIFSYDGQVTVGFMVDAGLVPDPDAIVRAVDAELAALLRPVRSARPAA
ncbi:MAG TPA: wax ester/triacylglycerol synthase family O-acyltransferase [Conexibacter sp.]|nr:wax ester/triacylglycerol synthase family O-acyltransferase [Conexibacter sp.]